MKIKLHRILPKSETTVFIWDTCYLTTRYVDKVLFIKQATNLITSTTSRFDRGGGLCVWLEFTMVQWGRKSATWGRLLSLATCFGTFVRTQIVMSFVHLCTHFLPASQISIYASPHLLRRVSTDFCIFQYFPKLSNNLCIDCYIFPKQFVSLPTFFKAIFEFLQNLPFVLV